MRYPHWFSSYAQQWLAAWVGIAIASLLIVTVAIDMSGRQDWNHSAPLPRGVIRLNDSSYLIPNSVDISEPEIALCSQTRSGGKKPYFQYNHIDQGLYVECNHSQTWSDKRDISVNFGEAMISTFTNVAWYLPIIGLGLIIASPFLVIAFRIERNKRRTESAFSNKEISEAVMALADRINGLDKNLDSLSSSLKENDLI